MTINWKTILGAVALLGTGVVVGALLFGGGASSEGEKMGAADAHSHAEERKEADAAVWTCSMHPAVQSDRPGSCPICGMELIPANQSDDGTDYTMAMSESARKLADIQTTEATREVPTREIDLPGRVQVDERRITTITAHFPGRIRSLTVDFTGAPIQKGEPMATIYSPELISAQRELLEAVRHADVNPSMVKSARKKLRLWELGERTIRAIEERGEVRTEIEIDAPVSGHVLSRNVAREQHVQEGTILYKVADLSRVWVVFEAYEEDLQWLSTGDEVSFTMRSDPGTQYTAPITYIDPVVDAHSRTVRVRAEMRNPDRRLKPDMLVRGTVRSEGQAPRVTVPARAVLWTGPRSVVYVKDETADAPQFEMREVTLGSRAGDKYVIKEGIEAGEHVVTNGAFTVDSEFQLANRPSMMNPEAGDRGRPGHDHGGNGREGEETHMSHDDSSGALPTPPSYRDAVSAAFRAQLTAVVEAYIDAKGAMIAGDPDAVQTHLAAMDEAVAAVDGSRLAGDVRAAWDQDRHALQSHLGHREQLTSIEALRGEFRTLSRILAYTVEQFGVEKPLYRQYCPMAFDGEGAHWLSRTEQIENPYRSDMPTCGETTGQF